MQGLATEQDIMIDMFMESLLDFKLDRYVFEQERAAIITELSEWMILR